MEMALIAARAVQFASAMIVLGTPLLRLGLGLGFEHAATACGEFDRWLRRLMLIAAALALASALAWLDLEAAIMGDGWGEAIDSETIEAVLLQTTFGHAWIWHLAFGATLLATLLFTRVWAAARGWAILGLAAGLVASLAWAGHAVMQPGSAHVMVQVIHLLAAAVWLGSLPALYYLLERSRRAEGSAWHTALIQLLPRYSRAGYCAVAAVVLTGCLNSWFLVGSLPALVATDFGRVLLAKVGLVLVMVAVAAINRVHLAPRIRLQRVSQDQARALVALWRNVATEQLLGALVIVAVSVLGTLPPAIAH